MNRTEFIAELKKCLHKLPFDEIKETAEYYEQYFEDAGIENEQVVITALGSPFNVAAGVIAEFAIKDVKNDEKSAKSSLSAVWMVILAIFASPIAFPLALAVVIVAVAFIIVIFALIFSFGAVGLALLLSGAVSVIASIPLVVKSVATALFFLGFGSFSVGLGISFLLGTVSLAKKCFGCLAKLLGKFILRRNTK